MDGGHSEGTSMELSVVRHITSALEMVILMPKSTVFKPFCSPNPLDDAQQCSNHKRLPPSTSNFYYHQLDLQAPHLQEFEIDLQVFASKGKISFRIAKPRRICGCCHYIGPKILYLIIAAHVELFFTSVSQSHTLAPKFVCENFPQ